MSSELAVLVCSVVLLALLMSETASHLASGPHIADVNILLPPRMTHPVEYRLQGSDGCFKWSWDHHDFLSVIPEYNSSNHCSTSARLRSIAPYSGRKETAVYAADIRTGNIIRCKVFIDKFSRIQIFHNSIKLDLDGLTTLRVRAFDTQENVFSSLVGLQFIWKLTPETDGLHHHLAHLPLKDSPLSDCGGLCGDLDIQIQLEDSGVFSDLYAVKGIEIGHEIVSVNLFEPGFESLADKIVLTVAEAMSIEPPSPVFVLIGAVVQYTLRVIRGNMPQVVTLPSPHHRWLVSNSSVAKVDSLLGTTNALQLGVTNVVIEDTRVEGNIQVSSLKVVLPDFLSLFMSPLLVSDNLEDGTEAIPSTARWYVVTGHKYLIQIKIFSKGLDVQEIYITERDDIKLYDDQTNYWQLFPVSNDLAINHGLRNSRFLKATSQGLGKLTATLSYFSRHNEMKEVLKVVQEVMVCDQVKLNLDKRISTSQSILLPWNSNVRQELKLTALGGCAKSSNDYKWFSSDSSIVFVSTSGVIQAKKPGKATIKVLSAFDSFNYDEVVVDVSVPVSMVMLLNFPVETVVGSHIQAAVTMKAPNGAFFYKCDAFSSFIKWKVGGDAFVVVNTTRDLPMLGNDEFTPRGPPCSWTSVYASRVGRDVLHASLSKESLILRAFSGISSYPPLRLRQAGDGNRFGGYWFDLDEVDAENRMQYLEILHLAPGTYLDVMLLGGPEQWDKSVDFIENVKILDEEYGQRKVGADVHPLSGGSRSLYRVLCHMPGYFRIGFERGNLVADDHPLPVIEKVVLSLTCNIPSSIVVLVDEPVNRLQSIRSAYQGDRNPGKIRATPITVANGRTVRLSAIGVSDNGEAFGNSSSLHLKWELSGCVDLAYWDENYDLKATKYGWERHLRLQNESGLCIVRATAIGFSDTSNEYGAIQLPESFDTVLTDAVSLQLVSTLRVSPEFNLLFYNPDAKVNLSISGGSCFLEASVNASKVVEVVQLSTGQQCVQLALSPKGLGTALVTVHDVGLALPTAVSAVVQVVDMDWIKIASSEEISIMLGSVQTIDLVAGISDGSSFDSSQFAYMKIQVHIEDNVVELFNSDGAEYLNTPRFKIAARHLGITSLFVSAIRQSGHEILSQPIKIEVYMPPKVNPQDIFLAPGASFVVTVKRGPTIGAHIEYTTEDEGIAVIHNSSGRLSAISLGNTTIIASIYGNGDTVICRAYGSVRVGVPSAAMLSVQSEQLAVGREMPINPLFPEGDLFGFYELCRNYRWNVEDEKVLGFSPSAQVKEHMHGVQAQSNSYLSEKELGFINILYGRSAGKTKVTISFSCEFTLPGSKSITNIYNASISLLVVPDLPLALGVPMTWLLPPHYTTKEILPLSSDSYGKNTITYSLLSTCYKRSEGTHKEVVSVDGDKIRTTESNNIACIQAKDRVTGRSEVAACIKVVEVSQIRFINEELPFGVISLAVGSELSLPVSYRDALGNPFHEAHEAVLFDVVTNYPDIVFVNDTNDGTGNIYLKAIRQGRALLRVSCDNFPTKSDYILISVGAHIHPQNPVLPKGTRVNFSIEGLNDHISGRWVSANSSVISVDIPSGIAEAVGDGTTHVYFEARGLKLKTTVTVLTNDIVSVDAPKEMLTNVPYPTKGYSFLVKLSKFKAYETTNRIVYDCRVDPPFVGYAKPWSDLDSSNLYCLFFPYSPEHMVDLMPKVQDMTRHVSISIHVSLKEAKHISGSATALFICGFSVLGLDKLNLTPELNKTVVTVIGNTGIEFFWHERSALSITPVHTEDLGFSSHSQFEVKVHGNRKFEDKITIRLPANGQKMEINVDYEPKGASKSPVNVTLWASVLGCFALLILTATIFIYFLDRPARSQPSMAPPPSMATVSPATPDRSPAAALSDDSPRTPQPFMEYVRRTIDETPYYRRDGRRRFNPQNTL